jgi:lipopolysaccharide export system protein LptA
MLPLSKSQGGDRVLRRLGVALIAVAVMAVSEARAQGSTVQGVPNAMQGFSQNRDKPIQIDAASLEVRDKDKAATFKGDVKVVQGDTTMRCQTLVVFYESGASPMGSAASPPPKPTMTSATPGPSGSSSIRRLEAKGGVIVTQKDQTATGENGVFDMKSNTMTMKGNVILTKGDNVLKGDTLIVDMTTGVSKVEVNSGKVRMLIPNAGKGTGQPGATSLFPGSNSEDKTAPAGKPAPGASGKPTNLNGLSNSGKH